MTINVLIADDEPILRKELIRELTSAMPEVNVVAEFGDGGATLSWLKENSVDVAFLDIQMPGLSGLDVAQSIVDAWPCAHTNSQYGPLIVFVTAYDKYALKAFEAEAVDYLLKPVTSDRLLQTLSRVKERLVLRENMDNNQQMEVKLKRALNQLSSNKPADNTLRAIRASIGEQVRLVPLEEIALFHAEHKYVNVYTATQHALIRVPIKELLSRLPTERFVQIHRSSIVNMSFVEAAVRQKNGKITLKLRGVVPQPVVSRPFRHLFKAM